MNPDRWQEITHIFHAALDRDERTRRAFVEEACRHDPSLRAEIEALIAAHRQAGSFGEVPLVALPISAVPVASVPPSPLTGVEPVGRCSRCGGALMSEPGLPGLCPSCLLGFALQEPDPSLDRLFPGRILGERYQILEHLGRGGMGEVFRAFDLKLRVDVALKAVQVGHVGSDRAREALRREVRAAREVVSPNVCRIFDLIVADGEELVSMEYIDGVTLADRLRERGPLPLQDAREIASQFLSGLTAIHRAGLVHRDFKPENVMITRAGRVVVMDFGLANIPTERGGRTISGTPAYMAPEQARGEGVDARADVFAAGIVLVEMLVVGGDGHRAAREALWRAVREIPPQIADGPWAPVLRQSLAPNPKDRYASIADLAHALEEVTLRLPGFEEQHPYPGLASFSEADAEYFFGREAEVETLWKKLKRPRLLALVGPSGAGKSSFLRAGLLPALPRTWKAIITTPGSRPFQSLAEALAPTFAGDAHAIHALLRFEDEDTAVPLLARFRHRHTHAIIIVDQFEELFTLCSVEVQQAFARLLGRLVLEADIHVLVSLRDDFLLHCQAYEALAPAFTDLTPLGTLGEAALRRALTQPALACAYRFEDESLVDDMVKAVSRERGALPLLAFAASRLWEKRDRERGMLTREAYHEIGGVAGALAQHAEMTLERIGTDRIPLVRELFRNLVTSQSTRAVPDREELLSVFDRMPGSGVRARAEEVLNALIDARLLTSYERAGEAGESHRYVEIIHESLLTAWPRLARWQTQDADGAQLRDQLRQAAQAWHDRGRPDDLLWSGTAYRDFAVWRERYAGGLTDTEEAFARAATRRDGRQRRQRRLAVAAALCLAGFVTAGAAGLYQRADRARQRAEAETQRAEAGRLLVLGERDLDRHPTGALAFALKSLELTDTAAGRLLALRVLQQSPVARIAPVSRSGAVVRGFSDDGEWLAVAGFDAVSLLHKTGGAPRTLIQYPSKGVALVTFRFRGRDALMAKLRGDLRLVSVPEGREIFRTQLGDTWSHYTTEGLFMETIVDPPAGRNVRVSLWAPDKPRRQLGTLPMLDIDDVEASWLAYAEGRRVYLRSFDDWAAKPRPIFELPSPVQAVVLSADGSRVAANDSLGRIEVWTTDSASRRPERVLQVPGPISIALDPSGRWLAVDGRIGTQPVVRLFDGEDPRGVEPLALTRGDSAGGQSPSVFDRSGQWLSTASGDETELWWLGGSRPHVYLFPDEGASSLRFTPDGRWLLAAFASGIRALPMTTGVEPRMISNLDSNWRNSMAVEPSGRTLAVGLDRGRLHLIDLESGASRALTGFSERTGIGAVAFGAGGKLLAAAPGVGPREEKVVRVFDLQKGAVSTSRPLPGAGNGFEGGVRMLTFDGTSRVLALVEGTGLVSVDLASGTSTLVMTQPNTRVALTPDRRSGVGLQAPDPAGRASVFGFSSTGQPVPLEVYESATEIALDPSGRLVATGNKDGTVRVGLVAGGEPHLLLGHRGAVRELVFSPDSRWLASTAADGSVRIWPVPDVSRTPTHKLGHEDLLSKLRLQTNLRAVKDERSAAGYVLKPDPFPGWASPPPQ